MANKKKIREICVFDIHSERPLGAGIRGRRPEHHGPRRPGRQVLLSRPTLGHQLQSLFLFSSFSLFVHFYSFFSSFSLYFKNFIASFLFCPLFSWGPKSPVHSPQSDWRFRLGLLCCRRHFMAGPIRILLLLPLSGNFSLSSIPSISSHPPIAVVHSPFRRCPSIQLVPLSQETLFPCLPLPVFCWTFESARLYSLPLPLQLLLSRVDNLVCLSSREHTVHHSALLPNTINTWALPSRRLLS